MGLAGPLIPSVSGISGGRPQRRWFAIGSGQLPLAHESASWKPQCCLLDATSLAMAPSRELPTLSRGVLALSLGSVWFSGRSISSLEAWD